MKVVEQQCMLYFLVQLTLIKLANAPLDRSAALVLSVINWTYCSCTGICQIRQEIWPEPDFRISEKWPDPEFAGTGAEIWYNPTDKYSL